MKLEFRPNKVIWQFQVEDGWKSWDGKFWVDSEAEPKEMDLSEPNNPDRVALCIYKIEGGRLTILMGAERPTTFHDPSTGKLVLTKE